MDKKRYIKKIPFWILAISFAIYFYYSFTNPEQTNYWITNHGLHIIMLEVYGLFSLIFLLAIAGFKLEGYKLYSKIMIPFWILLIIIFLAVYYYVKDYTLWLILFFVTSNVIKFSNFIQSEENYAGAYKSFIVTFIALIASAFIIAFPAAFFYRASDNLIYGLWGMLYFILLIIVDLIAEYYRIKSEKTCKI